MVAEDWSVTVGRRWYQKTWLWIAVAFAAIPLALVYALIRLSSGSGPVVVSEAIAALVPVGLWMGALVTRSGWVRGILSISTVLLLFLSAWAVWNFVQELEAEALVACTYITTSEGEEVELDSELCESVFDGSLESDQRTIGIRFAVFWVAPLFVLYFFRKRFQPDDVMTGKTPS